MSGEKFMWKKLLVFALAFCLGIVVIQIFTQNDEFEPPLIPNSNVQDNSRPTQSYKQISLFFNDFQKAVAENNKAKVASFIKFPVEVQYIGSNGKLVEKTVKSETEFLLNYNKIFDNSFKDSISLINSERFFISTSCEMFFMQNGIRMKVFGVNSISEIPKIKDLEIKIIQLHR